MKTTTEIIMVDEEECIHCPVCGRLVQLFDVCECNWENTGETNIDGGPNKMTAQKFTKSTLTNKQVRVLFYIQKQE